MKNTDIPNGFVIAGPDSGELTKTKKLAHELGVKDRVIFAGTLTEHEKISAYHSASLFAIPSRREGLPLTLIEALASGLPIVGSDVDSLPYFVKNGVNGFLSGYGNYKQLAQNIILILKNKKLHDKMSRKNRVQAKNYTWQKISRELLDLYEE